MKYTEESKMTIEQLVRQVLSDYKRSTTFSGQEMMYE